MREFSKSYMKNISLIALILCSLLNPLGAQESEVSESDVTESESDVTESGVTEAEEETVVEDESLDSSIEALKKEVLSLNRDLFILEEDLLFPANTQFSIFLSMNAGSLFALDSIQIKIDDKNISNHLYTERELGALKRGGVQRLYLGNLPSGEHEIIAIFTGIGPKGRDYRRGETVIIEKTTEPQFVEFIITDDSSKEQPEFDVRVWE